MKAKYYLLASLITLIVSCKKINIGENGTVDLFLIEKYEKLHQSCQIDEKTVKTENFPFLSYKDFESYDNENYTFKLTNEAAEKVKNLKPSVFGLPFALKANNELIYTGYFWPSYSSASCAWVIIDPIMMQDNQLKVQLGYPGQFEGQSIPDKRNDERILSIFRKDKKLR